ncbi:MAG: glycosyltransferase [Chlorobiota bacterium]|jgi:glycosyltransferase involved in cell wall biosynthesis|nr:glycosyltransferase [Chlorobiota bacterium]
MPPTWDVCILSMSEVQYDARTLNVARSLTRMDKRVCLSGWGNASVAERLQQQGIAAQLRPRPAFPRMALEWGYFMLWNLLRQRHLRARAYWAADLYSLPIAAHLARRFRACLFYDSRELYFALASLHKRPLTQRILQRIESHYIRRAHRCIVSGWLDAEEVQRHYHLPAPPVVLLNVPPYRVPPRTDLLRRTLRIPPNAVVLLYQGAVFAGRGLVHALQLLCSLPEAVLCILGDGPLRPALQQMARQFNVTQRLFWLGWRPYEELLEWTASADIGLALIEPISRSYELALPNKVFEYCMAGIPTIATALPALQQLFERYRIGVLLSPELSIEELRRAVRTLRIPEVWNQYHERCRQAATQLCWEAQHSKLVELWETTSC